MWYLHPKRKQIKALPLEVSLVGAPSVWTHWRGQTGLLILYLGVGVRCHQIPPVCSGTCICGDHPWLDMCVYLCVFLYCVFISSVFRAEQWLSLLISTSPTLAPRKFPPDSACTTPAALSWLLFTVRVGSLCGDGEGSPCHLSVIHTRGKISFLRFILPLLPACSKQYLKREKVLLG